MKVLKKIVAIGAMVCMCVALGGTKVAEAAACTSHDIELRGSLQYSLTTSHEIWDVSKVAEYCTKCHAVLKEREEIRLDSHTNPKCAEHYKEPVSV